MQHNTNSLIHAIAHRKAELFRSNQTQTVLSISSGVYLLVWAVCVGLLFMHSVSFSLPLAFLCLTPSVVLFYFSLSCIRQQGELTGTIVSYANSTRFWNNQVRFLLLFPLSSASFLAIEWAYPFLLSLHFTVIPLAYTIATSLSLLCLVCLIQTITSACTTGINIPHISMPKRLVSWTQGATTLQHPFSTPYTERFLSELITTIKKNQDCKTSQPLPLEYALGFMDAKIFANCMRCYDSTSPEYQASCQAVRHILTPFLNHKYDLDIKTLSILQSIFSILPSHPKSASPALFTTGKSSSFLGTQTTHLSHSYKKPNPFKHYYTPTASPPEAPLFPPAVIAHSDTLVQSVTQSLNTLPFPASLFPSLTKTLHHIPLPSNNQISYLQNKTLFAEYNQLRASINCKIRSHKHAPSLFQRLYRNEYSSIREAFHAIGDKISSARSSTFGRLLIRLMRYHTAFHNPLFASIALNHPGMPHSVRLHKGAVSRKNLYLGITLVARAVKLAHELHAFLQDMNTPSNLTRHIDTLRHSCGQLIDNIFHGITQMSVGSTMPRFYLLHGGYRGSTLDIVQNHPHFHRLFSTSYRAIYSTNLDRTTRHKGLIPTESQIAARCSVNHSHTPAVSQAFSIWHQLSTPRLPFWYHSTDIMGVKGILGSGEIEVRHRLFSGAFISNHVEKSYGNYTFSFSQETPLLANTFNKTRFDDSIWHGSKAPIPLSPHLVAIGYPHHVKEQFFYSLSDFGEVHRDSNTPLAYFQYRGQMVFLLPQDDLVTINKIICTEGADLAQVFPRRSVIPLPAHLVHDVGINREGTQDQHCYPLSQQLDESNKALGFLLENKILN